MTKKVTALIMTIVMVLSVMGTPSAAQAASIPYMTVVCDGPVKEKVGDYYIWIKESPTEDAYVSDYELRCSKASSGKAIILKKVSDGKQITNVISNGDTIYYGVWSKKDEQMVIYKTSVTGKVDEKFRTVNNVTDECGPVTVYDGRLYFDEAVADIAGETTWNICSVNMSNNDYRLEKSGFKGQSGYGRFMTCDNESKIVKTQLYDAKNRKSTVLIKSKLSRVYDGSIYYGSWDSIMAYVQKTNLSGKNLETLVETGHEDSESQVIYLGKEAAYIKSFSFGNMSKVIYATKKLVDINDEGDVSDEDTSAKEDGGTTAIKPLEPGEGNGSYEYIMTVEPIPDVLFKGEAVYPKINVRVNGQLLKESQYLVNYYNNFGVGYGKAEIEVNVPDIIGDTAFPEDWARFNKTSETVQFKILHPRYKTTEGPVRDISKVSNYYYTGKPIIPKYKVWGTNVYYNKGVLLKEGVDYTANITNNVKPGTATITVKGVRYSNTLYRTFKILKAPISKVTVKGIKDKVYTGKSLKQSAMTLTYNGKKLVKGKDYTVKYKNNVKCGKASVIITGKGTYFTGKVTKTFTIVKNKPAKVVISSVKSADPNSIKITWKKADYAKKYQVWRATSKKGKYKLVKTTTATTFTDKKLITGKTYYYKLRAVNGTLTGKLSSIKSAAPAPEINEQQ